MISPLLWQTVPFKDNDAWQDFLGMHASWHREMSKLLGTGFNLYDDLRISLDQHAEDHGALADKLGLSRAGDLESFDLNEATSFAGFMWVHALDSERLRIAAGLT